jgi:Na+/melibiose symporter-like transporter
MIYFFGFSFSIAFTPFQALYPVECLNFENRAKGMASYNFWVNIAAFFNQYVTPIGLGDFTWRFYFLYIAWDTFQAIFIYLFYVETKDRTLEVSTSDHGVSLYSNLTTGYVTNVCDVGVD